MTTPRYRFSASRVQRNVRRMVRVCGVSAAGRGARKGNEVHCPLKFPNGFSPDDIKYSVAGIQALDARK